ncbi:MAG: substrate-binding domain-containing protein [Acidobacteriota bacterium]|jgi:tungstate transport system substrate-binding protein|nr:substrate-binding domain-containing protein [Acidobacteriota bacterium]
MSYRRIFIKSVSLLLVAALASALSGVGMAAAPVLKMATTTSTDNTGLLDYLAPILLKDEGIELQWVSVGTGKALEYGRNGDVDVVLTHDPESEKPFIDEGFGVEPKQVMYNDFVVIGPASDPAGIKGKSASEAFKLIAAKNASFASRADKSGTHMAELRIWKAAGVAAPDKERWYIQTGQGMLDTINVAGERGGYVLTDRGTFIKYEANHKGKPPLVIVVEGDDFLTNQYSVIPVNPKKHDNVKYDLAKKLSNWLTSPKTQKAIADFKLEGKQLFFPNAKR